MKIRPELAHFVLQKCYQFRFKEFLFQNADHHFDYQRSFRHNDRGWFAFASGDRQSCPNLNDCLLW